MPRIDLNDIEQKSHPYRVPEGYFEDLNASILARTGPGVIKGQPLWYQRPVWQLAAASFVILIAASLLFKTGNSAVESDVLAGVTDEEIIIYLANNDFSTSEIVEHLNFTEEDNLIEGDELLDDIEINDSVLDDLYDEYGIEDQSIQNVNI